MPPASETRFQWAAVGTGVAVKVWIVVQQAWAEHGACFPPKLLVAAATPGT